MAIIECYRRRASSVKETLIEMYPARGLSAADRRHQRNTVGHASVALDRIGLNKKIFGAIEA
jgi:hypothetical protein